MSGSRIAFRRADFGPSVHGCGATIGKSNLSSVLVGGPAPVDVSATRTSVAIWMLGALAISATGSSGLDGPTGALSNTASNLSSDDPPSRSQLAPFVFQLLHFLDRPVDQVYVCHVRFFPLLSRSNEPQGQLTGRAGVGSDEDLDMLRNACTLNAAAGLDFERDIF